VSPLFIIGALIVAGLFGYLIYRSSKATLKQDGPYVAPRWGAWQDHNMGTTGLEPGELMNLEKDLHVAPKRED
jgi:hypothetical protein